MANFTPSGTIYIGNAPFDNSYRHTMTFPSKSAQSQYFASVCTAALAKTDYTYVRMNNSIRVPFNAERLYTYDYVMYKNENYGDKWFYAFIVAVNYVNANMTELVLELDVMQTWYFDYTLEMGFVEREHVNDDSIGAHLNAEPPMELQYRYQDYNTRQNRAKYAVFLVTAFPKYTSMSVIDGFDWGMPGMGDLTIVDGNEAVSGGIYQGQISACAYLVYDLENQNSVKTMYRDMQAYNAAGAGDAIVDAFTIADDVLIPEQDLIAKSFNTGEYDVRWTFKNNVDLWHYPVRANRPTDLDGYYPKNNKLFTYPFCYLEVGDFSGRCEDYRFEYFEDVTEPLFTRTEAAISDSVGYLIPNGYKGIETPSVGYSQNDAKPFTYDCGNKIPWMYSAYANWAAQNALGNTLTVIGSMASIGFSLVPGIGAASKVLGAGRSVASGLARIPGGAGTAAEHMDYMTRKAISQGMESSNKTALAGGAAGLAGAASQYYKMERVPNSARGNTSGNAKFQNQFNGYYISPVVLRNEFAHIVDDFFSMYGYQVDRVKIPNREGRRNWNYIKMQNSCHRGSVPASDMDKINTIYDSGITFWHTSDIGNYSLDNSIVS